MNATLTLAEVRKYLKERGGSGEFSHGSHTPNGEFCVMEFASQLHKEEWTDHPKSYDPAWAAFCRVINDATWPDNKTRTKECLPLLLCGLKGTLPKDFAAKLALRTIREIVPIAFEAAAKLHDKPEHQKSLRDHAKKLKAVTDLSAAESAAWSAAESAESAAESAAKVKIYKRIIAIAIEEATA